MSQKEIILQTRNHIKELLTGEGTGHDWFHIERVVTNAKHIAKKEGGNMFVIELAALLHDIADWKFHQGDENIGARKAQQWLEQYEIDKNIIQQIVFIVKHISFKGGTNKTEMNSIEGKIVQDADRLDAIGAIGIARVFAFGGSKGRPLYDPELKPENYKTFKDYKSRQGDQTSIKHFYEKLLLLKDKMNTKTGKKMAKKRHIFMETFLVQFYSEWEGTE